MDYGSLPSEASHSSLCVFRMNPYSTDGPPLTVQESMVRGLLLLVSTQTNFLSIEPSGSAHAPHLLSSQ